MKRFLFLFLLFPLAGTAQPLKIEQLEDSVFVVTTWRDYESSPYPANCLYVLTPAGAILIDTPWDTTQLLPLIDSIRLRHDLPVAMSLSTHFHDDRTGGINLLNELNIPTWSSEYTKKLCTERHFPIARNTFLRDTTFTVGGVSFETFYPGPGHAPDNIVAWFPDYDLLYGGCFIKSTESTTIGFTGDADLNAWKTGITAVRKRYRRPSYVIPGHQQWGSVRLLRHTSDLINSTLKP